MRGALLNGKLITLMHHGYKIGRKSQERKVIGERKSKGWNVDREEG